VSLLCWIWATNAKSCNTHRTCGLRTFCSFQSCDLPLRSRMGLGCSPFARHYSGNHYCFLFLRLLRCFSSPGTRLQALCVQARDPLTLSEGVSPFGDLRVKGCLPPHRSLSQAATSFIVFLCQGIHHIPLTWFSHIFILKFIFFEIITIFVWSTYSIVKVHIGSYQL
jgi:hypothetical protein